MFVAQHVTTHIVAGVVLEQAGKFLLVQEKQAKAHGLWNWPAGKVDEGESIEQAAVREAKEECGFDIALVQKLGIWQANISTPPKHAFLAKIIGGELKYPEDELLDAKWFNPAEIVELGKQNKLRGEWIQDAIKVASQVLQH